MQKQYVVQVNSAQEMVYRTLRDKIVSMELKPGTTISTQEIAGILQVSRTPVREAFIRLQRENLLDITPQRATVVAKIDLTRVHQERFIREALEMENMRKFVPAASPAAIARMRDYVQKQSQALEERRYADYIELDNLFHQLAFRETEEKLSLEIMQQMNGHYDRIRLITAWEGHIARNAIQEHTRLIGHIEKGDLKNAQQLLRAHLQQLSVKEQTLIDAWPEYFDTKHRDMYIHE